MAKKKKEELEEINEGFNPTKPNWKHVISTGSTVLDLAISGGRVETGGIPTGILVEIAGDSGSGKTGILTELCASVQAMGGATRFADPEARLDKEYAQITGATIYDEDYFRPKTVTELFALLNEWETNPELPNVFAGDSLAALSTDMEMESEDKMGMRRAKEFSQELRKHCLLLHERNVLLACTNQIRTGNNNTKVTPGGNAVPFYSSLRLFCQPTFQGSKIEVKKKIRGVDQTSIIGIKTQVTCRKNSLDNPFRKADIYVIFGYGVDDVRGNLLFLKENKKDSRFLIGEKDLGATINKAISMVEEGDLEDDLRQETIMLWNEIQEAFNVQRKRKKR
jgi:RecA/RadA recombinase